MRNTFTEETVIDIITLATMSAGYNFPPQEVSWLKRDVLLFAHSIGVAADELHLLYVSNPLALHTIMLTIFRNIIPDSWCFQHIL